MAILTTVIARPDTIIEARRQKINTAKSAILTLYVNRKQNSRVDFTRMGRYRDMTPKFYQELINDFRTLAQRMNMTCVIENRTIELCEDSQAETGYEAIVACAYDKHGNELHLCYAAI